MRKLNCEFQKLIDDNLNFWNSDLYKEVKCSNYNKFNVITPRNTIATIQNVFYWIY